jgi:hypothetical protein
MLEDGDPSVYIAEGDGGVPGSEIVAVLLEDVDAAATFLGTLESLMSKFTKSALGTAGTAGGEAGGAGPCKLAVFHEFRFILLFFRTLAWYAARMAVVASLAALPPLPALDGRWREGTDDSRGERRYDPDSNGE